MAAASVPLLTPHISKHPNLEIVQLRFAVSNKDTDPSVKAEKIKVLLQHIKDNEMGPFYELVTSELLLPVDKVLLTELKQKNTKKIQKIDAEILDAEQNGRKSEVCQAFRKKSEYLCQIGDKDAAVSAFHQTFEKTDGRGGRIDLVFNLIRLGFFFLDHKLISANINKAKGLIQYRDWESKNRLRAYEGLYKMATGDFKGAAALFLEAVPIFGSYELMSYEDLVFYTVLSTVYSLDRPELREKVMRCNEIQEQLTGGGEKGDLIPIRQYVDAFYNCTYDQFFIMLAQLESQRLKFDRYLAPHYDLYSLDMRLKAYEQFLIPHTAVRLDMMAKDFGVSIKVLRQELGCLILDRKKLNYSIDDVKQIILKNNPVPSKWAKTLKNSASMAAVIYVAIFLTALVEKQWFLFVPAGIFAAVFLLSRINNNS